MVQRTAPASGSGLRDHLLATSGTNASGHASSYPPVSAQPGPDHPYQASESPSSHEHLDPGVSAQQMGYGGMSADSAGEDASPHTAKGKRELSTSKRAAQNRAAQRAFRQRKEGYIKKLEEQVKEFQTMEQNYRALQNENYQLREYILNLQSRLLESSSDVPPAPPHMNLTGTTGATSNHRDHGDGVNNTDARLRQELEQHAAPSGPHGGAPAAANMGHDSAPPHRSPYGLGQDGYATRGAQDGVAADTKTAA